MSYLTIFSAGPVSICLPQYPPNERLDHPTNSPAVEAGVEAGKATDQEIEEAGGRSWLESELEVLKSGRDPGLAKTPSHIPT